MESADTDYDWLFPRGRFSHQARILETHLLYSGSLSESEKSHGAKLLKRTLSTLSPSSPRLDSFHRHSSSRSLPSSALATAKQALVPLTTREVVPLAKFDRLLSSRPEDDPLIGKLQHDLRDKEREAFEASQSLQKETMERVRLRGENRELGCQLERTLEQIGQLEAQYDLQQKQLASKDKAVSQLNHFLQDTAEKQTKARAALKQHMEELIQRAESAESEIATLRSSWRPVSRTSSSHLQPESPFGTLLSVENSRPSRSVGLHPMQNDSRGRSGLQDGLLPYADTNWPSTSDQSEPDRGWPSSRQMRPPARPQHGQTSTQHSTAGTAHNPESFTSPTLSLTDFDGLRPGTNFKADSGVGSSSTWKQPSVSQTRAPMVHPHDPGLYYMTSSRIPQEQASRSLYPSSEPFQSSPQSLSQSLNLNGIHDSAQDIANELPISPSVDSNLLQAYPGQQTSSTHSLNPSNKDRRDWDLNFLMEVMGDVLKNRDPDSRQMNNPPGAGHQRLHPGQSDASSLPADKSHPKRSTPSPYRQDISPTPANHHWSSSDEDSSDDDSESDEAQDKQTKLSSTTTPHAQLPQWRAAWLSVFAHLDTATLLTCAQVCREWRAISKHPSLWGTIRLANRKTSSSFLQSISKWCKTLEHLHLEGLKPRRRAPGESREKYTKNTWGSLEPGLEHILVSAGTRLITLKIVDCSNMLTERSLFLASCYCRSLYSLTYISQTNPVGHEVIWALGAGCRNIACLKVPPRQPCQRHQRLGNRCLQMIGRCWPLLLALSVGGSTIDAHGLVSVANNCPRLQVLELDHMLEVTEVIAIAMCQAGLRGLHTLILRNTLISPAAIIQFNGACPQLKSLSVYLSPSVCKGDNRDFHNIVSRLRALTKKRVLSDVLNVYAKFN